MSIKIDRASIQKLGHETQEIRLRTLEQIENKVARALTHNERIDFRPGELIKYLIRWFAFQPLQAKDVVLNLILKILKSRYREEVISYLGLERLRKELCKVKMLVKNAPEVQLVGDILNTVEGDGEVIEISDSLSVSDTCDTLSLRDLEIDSDGDSMSYEIAWSKASVPDYNSLKIISDILKEKSSAEDLHNALQHLQITMDDYPAEYFLQPPHIFKNLLELFGTEECAFEDLSETFICFSKSLLGRLRTRRKAVAFFSTKEQAVPVRSQLSVSTVCSALLELCMSYLKYNLFNMEKGIFNVFRLIMEVFRIIDMLPNDESPSIESIFDELRSIVKNLRDSFDRDDFPVMNRVKYLLVLFTMRKILVNEKYANLEPGTELKVALLDLPLSKILPEQYAQILKIFGDQQPLDSDMQTLLKSPEILKYSMEMLNNNPRYSDACIIENCSTILETFAIHENMDLVEKIFKSILTCVPLFAGDKKLRQNSDKALLKLFAHHSMNVKTFVYKETSTAMKRYFACLLNGENAFFGVNNTKLVEDHILGVPLTSMLLTEIATTGYQTPALKPFAEDIISLPIKGRAMLGDNWARIFDLILPNIPLYQCLTDSEKILNETLTLLDPDGGSLPKLDIFQGNLRFLFHPSAKIRSEALSRVIYIITSHENAPSLLPNVMEISDIIPNDCCVLQVPREVDRIFCGAHFDSGTVANLMQILMSADVEPLIRKTVLLQLNVVGQEEGLNRSIFEAGGWMICLQSLEAALQKLSHSDYPDSVMPIVGILSKLLFCDAQFRQELAKEENVLILLIRCLFLYVNDIALKQDAALCLFLLLFSSFVVGTKSLTVPSLLQNLHLPVKCQSRTLAAGDKSALEKLYLAEETSSTDSKAIQRFTRMILADLKFVGGLEKARFCTEYSPSLTKTDLRLIKSTSMSENIAKFLKYASNATEHENIVNSITSMRLIQLLCGGNVISTELVTKTFRRFIMNPSQVVLLENIVELFSTLVQVNNQAIISWLIASLCEEQPPLLHLLSNGTDTPLSLYRKVCALLSEVFQRAPLITQPVHLEADVFEALMCTTEVYFTKRDLDRTRCVLGVLQVLSGRRSLQTNLSKKQVYAICKKLFLFTIALKSFTQTGSDLQKNALLIISSLSSTIEDFQLTGSYLKYLSGLGGHNDYQVRTLAWCILARIAKSDEGADSLIMELAFLPGGFRACCLSTLLDTTEVAMVRQLAGLLFADLLKNVTQFEQINQILEKHDFYRIAHRSLQHFFAGELLAPGDRKEITTCDIVRAYCMICIRLVELKPTFCAELCEKALITKLYHLVKSPPTQQEPQKSFTSMVGEICNLYSRFSRNHLSFLQTTLCRDHEFLSYLCTFLSTSHPQQSLMSMLNLLMVVSKDQTGFNYICESFAENSMKIVNLVTVSLDSSLCNSLLQPTCLAFITFLLIKCQQKHTEHNCFSDTLETTTMPPSQKKYAAEVLFLQMNKLFAHSFPSNATRYDATPSASKVLLCEAIAVLLKTSDKARQVARNIKFLDTVLIIFNALFDSINVPCTTYVRRFGEGKKLAVIKHITLLCGIIQNWFSADVITDELQVAQVVNVIIRTWPWISHSNDLRTLFLKSLAFLSEKSVPMCRQFSVSVSSNANTILQLLVKLLTGESNKVKSMDSNSASLIKIGLRTVMNCCCCHEGRLALLKLHALDIFDSLHPFNLKSPKAKNDILIAWLTFWELFSRYPEGATSRNLIGLCTVINKCHDPSLRLIGLKILRNMTFLQTNRTTLLASADFLYTVNDVITNSECYSERLIVCTAIWRLISGGAKYAATIRNTKMAKKLNSILEDMQLNESEQTGGVYAPAKDLANVIEIILRILNS